MIIKSIAVVLLSGGMDSCVTLASAIAAGFDVAALHVNYGQRTQVRELKAYNDICNHYGIEKRLVVDISHLAAIGGSSLTDSNIPVAPGGPTPSGALPTSYVPFRNANILAIATSWAEVLGASAVFIGAVEEDSSGYPDCRKEFFEAFEKVIDTGTAPTTSIKILTPVINFSKGQIVEHGLALEAPIHLSWSCYSSDEKACGVCDSCLLRLKGFREAGYSDQIPYISV